MSDLAGGFLSAIGRGGLIGRQVHLTQMEVERRAAEDAQRLNLALDKQDFLEKRVTREQLLEEMDRETADIRDQDKVKRMAEEREDQIRQDEFEHEQAMLDIEAKRNKPRTRQQEEGDMLRDRREQDPEFDRRYTNAMLKELEIKGQPKPVTQAGARTQSELDLKKKRSDVISTARGRLGPPAEGVKPLTKEALEDLLMSQPGPLGKALKYFSGSRASDSSIAAQRGLPWLPPRELEQKGLGPIDPKWDGRSDLEKERDKLKGELYP